MFDKTFSVNGIHVDSIHKWKAGFRYSTDPRKETVKLFHELEELIRNAKLSTGGSFDYGLLDGDDMDMAFMAVARKGVWASLWVRGSEDAPESLSFAHVQMKDVRVFFVENPYKKRVYVIFSSKNKVHVGIISSWKDDFDFNSSDAVDKFYWKHYSDNSDKTMFELIKWLERKPWNMFRVHEDTKRR